MENIITKIEQQKKNKRRFNIYINDNYSFSVHEDILVSYRLYKGQEIDVENMQEVLEAEERNKAKQKALHYISYKFRTRMEVENYLKKKGFDFEFIEPIIKQMEQENLINDSLYANQFIKQRISQNPKGKRMLYFELKSKGIEDSIIQENLDKIDEGEEYDLAIQLIEKKISNFKEKEWNEVQRKLGNYLQRRGFSYHLIYKALQEYKDLFK